MNVDPARGARYPLPDTDVTIVVPVFNEAATVEGVVDRCLAAARDLPLRARVLVVDDGSTDWSADLQRGLAGRDGVDVVRLPENGGKGAALDRVFPSLSGRYAVVIDADGEYAPEEIDRLLLPLHSGHADWVMGSRYGFGRRRPQQYVATYVANRLLGRWFGLLSGHRFHDLLTGIFAFRTDCVRELVLRERRFAYTAELLWRVLRRERTRFHEVPVSYRFRTYGQGKKIRWWETWTLFVAIWRYRHG